MRDAMSRELQDERISAYLDGELSPGERAEVEELLRTSSSHQQLLAELTSIRESLRGLPHYTLGNDFAPRVTSAAQLAAREREALAEVGPRKTNHTAATHVEKAVAAAAKVQPRQSFRKWLIASAGGIAVTAASIALVIYALRGKVDDVAKLEANGADEGNVKQPIIEEPVASEFVRTVSSSKENEAVVVRIKLTKDAVRNKLLDNALAAHGIQMATADVSNEAARQTGLAYKEMIKAQTSSTTSRGAADVVFLEADVAQLEQALRDLEQNPTAKATFAPESLVASVGTGPQWTKGPEGEPGSKGTGTAIPRGGYFQHMPPRGFTLAPSASPPAAKPGEKVPAKKSARVLIVVEVVE
jgi:negative regulator of sigma E activity